MANPRPISPGQVPGLREPENKEPPQPTPSRKARVIHKNPEKPKPPYVKKHNPDGTVKFDPNYPHGSPPEYGMVWREGSSGVERDGTPWSIPGHWAWPTGTPPSHSGSSTKAEFASSRRCHITSAFIVLGGYATITDYSVPEGTRGHKLELSFGGLGVGGICSDGVISIRTDSWEEFYDNVHSFAYLATAPSPDIPTSKLAHTGIIFYDSNSKIVGVATPDNSADIGAGGGSVSVKR